MKIKAKGSFIHGSIAFKRGAVAEVSEPTGKALIQAGLAKEATESDEKSAGTMKKPARRGNTDGGAATNKPTGGEDGSTGVPAIGADQGTAQT